MDTQKTTARFWIMHNDDWCRVALRDGDSIELYRREEYDDGRSHTWTHYQREGDVITCDIQIEASDCEGRTEQSFEVSTTLTQLESAEPDPDYDFPPRPVWQPVDYSQRDHTAEAAGY